MMTRSRKFSDVAGYAVIYAFTAMAFIPLVAFILYVIAKGIGRINFEFLFTASASMESGGIFAPLFGTIVLTLASLLFAVPISLMAAVYLSEYARKDRWFNLIELTIVNLAGVPSVVYGLFGLGLFVIFLGLGKSIIAGALTMACMSMPLLITVFYQALKAVPLTLREASLAVGASKLSTTFRIVIPTALPGIFTGVILATARIAGETAPVLFTVAAYYMPNLPQSLSDQSMLLSYHLYVISTQNTGVQEEQKYAVTLVLVVLVLVVNLIAIWARARARKKIGNLG
ncbi:phosphate ABC transporter permease PstA [Turneriella parva]|uniref:Phosphate transport system permease protein PstA n=1 Tax=Turneriella parva (strain ATCC BAA-1111 / DSM 21527 / NCTC 11395 / H) TaxID=869212 RepID=I4BBP7_TURPD|nr:phosphate ABC transporter permease PstA [Turneriella parva]AFM14704.1 phosphate ABC transporter membrane protein 2, PhoT family [Turneriella parva DSM 21527]